MKSLTKVYHINASPKKVWDALTNPETIDEWGGGPAVMTSLEDQEFSLWDGDIFGKNLKVLPIEELIQEWYGGEWKEPSKVTFKLEDESGNTKLSLFQENVPDENAKDIDEGWDLYYLGAIKNLLEEN